MIDNELFEKKLIALKIPGRLSGITENAFYTNYQIVFNPDITISRVKARLDDISLFLGANVDIETSNGHIIIKAAKNNRDIVPLYDYTIDISQGIKNYHLPLIIGQNENGTRLFYDLVSCPHLLAAGATGSGKSVFLHNCILSMLYNGNASLILIDVKKVEFSIYENIPHLAAPICYDTKTALNTLKNLCFDMNKRYQVFKDTKCRNIQEYKEKGHKMQYRVCIIDELADLILSNKNIESYIIKLAQLGRAAGIHLILATQRPDSSILSGLIRANIPTRVCFAVQKATDSRIILDQSGGEKLQGKGDGLFFPMGVKKPFHFQAPYISTQGLLKTIEIAKSINN